MINVFKKNVVTSNISFPSSEGKLDFQSTNLKYRGKLKYYDLDISE